MNAKTDLQAYDEMSAYLRVCLSNEADCVWTGDLDRFLKSLAEYTALRFYALPHDEIPWMHRETEPTVIAMHDILSAYGFRTERDPVASNVIAARDWLVAQYRDAIYRLQSE